MINRIATLKQYLEKSPEDSFLQHALALEHIKLGNDAEAKALFTALLCRDEDYVGSYYHLARLLERTGEKDEAIKVYEKGMAMAKKNGDLHAYNELQAAFEELEF